MFSFSPRSDPTEFEAFSTVVSCTIRTCQCNSSKVCLVSNNTVVFYAKDVIGSGQLRACLEWDVTRVHDLDLHVRFSIDEGESNCHVSSFVHKCGGVSMMQLNDEGVEFGKEGMLFEQVYRTQYTFYVRNYEERSGSVRSGLTLSIDGGSVEQPKVYSLQQEEGVSKGVFTASTRYIRLLCIDVTAVSIKMKEVPLYSPTDVQAMASCDDEDTVATCEVSIGVGDPISSLLNGGSNRVEDGGLVTGGQIVLPEVNLSRVDVQGEVSPGRDLKQSSSIYAVNPVWEVVVSDTCQSKRVYTAAVDHCRSAHIDLRFVPSQKYGEFSWVCAEDEVDGCTGGAAWSSTACDAGVVVVPGPGVCGKAGCEEGYFGERCWHEGGKRKSCKDTWLRLGLFISGDYVDTLGLCGYCESDEDCKLFVYRGFWMEVDPVYDFYGSCELLYSVKQCLAMIPMNKTKGVCSAGVQCGDDNHMTIQVSNMVKSGISDVQR